MTDQNKDALLVINEIMQRTAQAKIVHTTPPATCTICPTPIKDEFYDFTLRAWGPTAWPKDTRRLGCRSCFYLHGTGLGANRGQRYFRAGDRFIQVEG